MRSDSTLPQLVFRLPLDPARLLRARQRIRDYLQTHAVDPTTVDAVVLAIEEAMTNAVRHSKAVESLLVRLAFEGRDLCAEVKDNGVGFDVDSFDWKRTPSLRAIGGRGLYLIARMMDEVELRRDGGLEVRMRKGDALPRTTPPHYLESGIIDGRLLERTGQREERVRTFVEEIDEGFAALDWEYRVTYANRIALDLYARGRDELAGHSLWDLFPSARESPVGRCVSEAMEMGVSSVVELHWEASSRWLECRAYPTSSGVSIYLRDIDERKRAESRGALRHRALRGVARILEAALSTQTEQELGEVCVSVAAEVTDSAFGLIGELGPDGRLHDIALGDPGWSLRTMDDQSGHRRPPGDVELHGLYGHVLVTGEPLIANAPSEHAQSQGLLEGQPPLTAFLGVPLKDGSGTVGIIAVANREGGYGEEQQEVLERLAPPMVEAFERKRAEEALRKSEEQSRHLLRYAPAAIFEIDYRGPKFVSVNDFMCRFSGYSREELLATNPFELLVEEDRKLFRDRIRSTLAGKKTRSDVEYRIRTKQGEELLAILNVTPTFEEGKPVGAFVIAYDITERKRAEEALRESEDLLRAVTDNSPDAVYVKDAESRWLMANPAVLRIVGRAAEDALGKTDRELYTDPMIGEAILANDRRTLESGRAEVFEEIADTPEGRRTFLSIKAPRRDAAGRTIGIVGISHDITERVQAEEALRESQTKYQALIETTSDFIWEMDPRGRYTYCSPQMETLWGLKPAEMLGKSPFDLMPDEEREGVLRFFRGLAESPRPFSGLESTAVVAEGRLVRIETSGVPFFDRDGRLLGFRGVSRDITERKRAEAEREGLLSRSRRELAATRLLATTAAKASSSLSLEQVCQGIIASIREELGDLRAASVYSLEEGGGTLRHLALFGYPEEVLPSIRELPVAESSNLGRVVMRHLSVLTWDSGDEAPESVERRRRMGLSDTRWLALPIERGGETLAVMALFFDGKRPFDDDELALFRGIAAVFGNAIANARLYQAQRGIAVTLQQAFLHKAPSLEGLELGIVGLSAAQPALVGGDFWDVVELPEKKLLLAVGDVAGKGVQAAALSESVRSAIHAFATVDESPAFILRKTNELLLADEMSAPFVTALVLVADIQSGRARLASAGHPGPVHIRRDSCVIVDPDYGPPLGSFWAEYSSIELRLAKGEYLVLYTDGVTDARQDGRQFGEERLKDSLGSLWGQVPQDVADQLASAASSFADTLKDDVQVLVVRWT